MAKKTDTETGGAMGFEKIAAEGFIKAYQRTEKGHVKVTFKDVLFSDGHRDLLDRIMDNEISVRVTIEVVDPTFSES